MDADMIFKAEGIKALVVDDNEVNSMVVASMLEQFSIEVTEAYSGRDAIEKTRYEDYDIIFMDYLMPEMNGIEATEEIRRLGKVKRPVIVALSANDTQELKEKFKKAGVDDVAAKPLELAKVCDILRKWVPDEAVERVGVNQSLDDSAADLKELFSHVDGLDVEKGLSHLANSSENYIKVIEAAIDNIETERKRLAVYSQSQVQPSSMKICFHSLKGVFLNLGAKQLSEQSQFFELACANTSVDLIADNLQQFLDDLDEFSSGLQEALAKYDDGYSREDRYFPLEEEEYMDTNEQLVYHLERYEYNELRELLQKLMYASRGIVRSKYEEIGKEIQNFQYEDAVHQLKELMKEKKYL